MRLLFRTPGLSLPNVWGGTAGNRHRARINLDEMEIMVVAEKSTRGVHTDGKRFAAAT
ncbi:MAG: hypothetical protein QUS33_12075 [Dehalococcoidia bacterium]|nr:hypothetical protein [Dehalococcoidia bacterium]